MKIGIITLAFFLLKSVEPRAQKNDFRSRLSIMVVPYTSSGTEDVLTKLEKDNGYKNAISTVNNALINIGYTKTIDFKTNKESVENKHLLLEDKAWPEKINMYIENAPVDIIIETEITWIDPPGNPSNRRAKLRLKAIDKYTSAVYADNALIQSGQREFPDLNTAVESALLRDGKTQFKSFLDQLDTSYSNLLRNGRAVNVQFRMEIETRNKFSDIIENERLSDKIEEFIRRKSLHGHYDIIGGSDTYLQFAVYIPIMDENGVSQTPASFLSKEMNSYFRKWGFAVSYSSVRNWMNFIFTK